jgi:Zn-dependent protease
MEFFIWMIVIIAFIFITILVKALKVLLLNPLRIPDFRTSEVANIPDELRPLYAQVDRELRSIGFKGFAVLTHESVFQNVSTPEYVVQYWHPEHRCYANVSLNHAPSVQAPVRVSFTAYQNGVEYSGTYKEANTILKSYPGFKVKDHNHDQLSKRFAAYIEDVQLMVNTTHNQLFKPQEMIEHLSHSTSQYFHFLQEQGYAKKHGNTLKSTWKGAFALIMQIIRNPDEQHDDKKADRQKLIHEQHALAEAEASAYQKHHEMNHNTQFNNWIKTLIFVVSAVAFAVLFGTAFSYTMLLALIPVLLFHELGHYVMMKAFRYQDLQILFLPLGAAVTGKERNTSVLKKVLVYLAGPAPGLILSYVIYANLDVFLDSAWSGFIFELALMAFIINYFNLLPIQPLDGGRITDLVLFSRMPVVQLIFQIISVLMFFVLAMWLNGTLIYVLAFFLLFTLLGEFKNMRLKVAMKNQTFSSEKQLLKQLFWALRSEPMTFEQRRQIVEQVKPQLEQPKARWHEVILGLLMYLTLLLSPVYMAYKEFNWLALGEQYTSEYWQQQVAQQSSVTDKLASYEEAFSVLSYEEGFYVGDDAFLKEAITFVQTNQLQHESLYLKLVKMNFLNDFYANPEASHEAALQQIITEFGADHPVVGHLYVAINTLSFHTNSRQQLEQAMVIARSANDAELKVNALNLLAKQETHTKRFEEAIATTRSLIEADPENSTFRLMELGYLYLLTNDQQTAEEVFTHVISQAVDDFQTQAWAYEGLGWVQLESQNMTEAAALFTRADSILQEAYDDIGIEYIIENLSPHHHIKWMVLYDQNGDPEGLTQSHKKWVEISTRHSSYEDAVNFLKTIHDMASPKEIYLHPMIKQAMDSVQ